MRLTNTHKWAKKSLPHSCCCSFMKTSERPDLNQLWSSDGGPEEEERKQGAIQRGHLTHLSLMDHHHHTANEMGVGGGGYLHRLLWASSNSMRVRVPFGSHGFWIFQSMRACECESLISFHCWDEDDEMKWDLPFKKWAWIFFGASSHPSKSVPRYHACVCSLNGFSVSLVVVQSSTWNLSALLFIIQSDLNSLSFRWWVIQPSSPIHTLTYSKW